MKDIALNPATWDLEYSNRDQRIVEGVECLVQRLTIKLGHISGEWYLDTSTGVINMGLMGRKNPPIGIITGLIRSMIENDPEIMRVVSLESSFDAAGRSLFVSYEAESIYGIVRKSEEVEI